MFSHKSDKNIFRQNTHKYSLMSTYSRRTHGLYNNNNDNCWQNIKIIFNEGRSTEHKSIYMAGNGGIGL